MARRACQRVPVRQGLCPRGYLPIGRLHYPNTVSGNRLENLVKRLATKRHAGDMRAMRLQTRLTELCCSKERPRPTKAHLGCPTQAPIKVQDIWNNGL